MSQNKYFVLGDSRTGTTSLHHYFLSLGIKSIHHYENEASIQLPYNDENHNYNFNKLIDFIETGDYDAFSDYPTRLFYKLLYDRFPSAYYILSVRKNISVWKSSMARYFSELNVTYDEQVVTEAYISLNNQIVDFFSGKPNFLIVDIDMPLVYNQFKLNKFLVRPDGRLGWFNTVADHLNHIGDAV